MHSLHHATPVYILPMTSLIPSMTSLILPMTSLIPSMTSPILPRSSTLVRTFGPALVLGLSGDQTQHVLWRLQEGDEFRPAARAGGEPAVGAGNNYVVLVLIGTNNIGSGHLPGPAAEGVARLRSADVPLATPVLKGLASARRSVSPKQFAPHRPQVLQCW